MVTGRYSDGRYSDKYGSERVRVRIRVNVKIKYQIASIRIASIGIVTRNHF